MLPIFAAMAAAFVSLEVATLRVAVGCALVGLLLAIALFLFEIHDPVDGFRLPWLQVRTTRAVVADVA